MGCLEVASWMWEYPESSPLPMRSSLLIGAAALLAVLVAALIWSLAGGESTVHATAPALLDRPRASEGPAAELAEVSEPRAPERRSEQGPESVRTEASARREAAAPEGGANPVVVRASIAMADGSAFNFAGFTVEAQSWETDTDAVELHTTEVGEKNIAEFRFEGPVHLDFVRIVPPRELALAFGYVEDHIDLDPGDEYTPLLEVAPGAELSGRVLDDFGLPVQGVRVHAYADDTWSDLSDWDPGLVAATTGPDGRFLLPILPPGSWGLSVEPQGWLQISPNLGDPSTGTTWFELEAGQRLEGGDIVITSLHRLSLQVLDGAGSPAPQAAVELEPVEFRSPKLTGEDVEPLDEVELFLSGIAPGDETSDAIPWPYGQMGWTTDADGRVQVLGVSGSWNLRVRPRLGTEESEVLLPLELPAGDQVVRLPSSLWTFRGRMVDPDGKPIGRLTLRLAESNGGGAQTTRSDGEDGRFAFEGLPPGDGLRLYTMHKDYIDSVWDVPFDPGTEPRDFIARRASSLNLVLRDPQQEPLSRQRLSILSGEPSTVLSPQERELFDQISRRGTQRISARNGKVSFSRLPAGRYVVALMLAMTGEQTLPNGQPRMEMRPYQTWELETGEDTHELVCDLSGYVRPTPPPQAQHRGTVRDASTGAPVPRAMVRFQGENFSGWARTDDEGQFYSRQNPGTYGLEVMHERYEQLVQPARTYAAGEVTHDLLLWPGGRSLSVRLVDAQGQALPTVYASFVDSEGAPVTALVNVDEGGRSHWRDGSFAQRGRLEFENVPVGRLVLVLNLGGTPVGKPSIEVLAAPAAQSAELSLPFTLDELRARVQESRSSGDE